MVFGLLANERNIRIRKADKYMADQTFEQQVLPQSPQSATPIGNWRSPEATSMFACHQIELANKLYSEQQKAG